MAAEAERDDLLESTQEQTSQQQLAVDSEHVAGAELPAWQTDSQAAQTLIRGLTGAMPQDVSVERLWDTNVLLTDVYMLQKRIDDLEAELKDIDDAIGAAGITAKRVRMLGYIAVWKSEDPEFYALLSQKVKEMDQRYGAE